MAIDGNSGARVTISREALSRMQQARRSAQPKVDPSLVHKALPLTVSASSSTQVPPLKKSVLPQISPNVELIELSPLLQKWLVRKDVSIVRGKRDDQREGAIDPIEEMEIANTEGGSAYIYAEPTECWCLKMVGMTEMEIQQLHEEVFIPVPNLWHYFQSEQNTLYLTLEVDFSNRLKCWGEKLVDKVKRYGEHTDVYMDSFLEKGASLFQDLHAHIEKRTICAEMFKEMESDNFYEAQNFCNRCLAIGNYPSMGPLMIQNVGEILDFICLSSEGLLTKEQLMRFYETRRTHDGWKLLENTFFMWRRDYRRDEWERKNEKEHFREPFAPIEEDRVFFEKMRREVEKILPARLQRIKNIDTYKKQFDSLNTFLKNRDNITDRLREMQSLNKRRKAILADLRTQIRCKHEINIALLQDVFPHKSFIKSYLTVQKQPSVASFVDLGIQTLKQPFSVNNLKALAERIQNAEEMDFLLQGKVFIDLSNKLECYEEQIYAYLPHDKRLQLFAVPPFSTAGYNEKWHLQIEQCWQEECFSKKELCERISLLEEVQANAVNPLKKYLLEKKLFLEKVGVQREIQDERGATMDVQKEYKKVVKELGALGIKERVIKNLTKKAVIKLKMLQTHPHIAQRFNSNRKVAAAEEEKV